MISFFVMILAFRQKIFIAIPVRVARMVIPAEVGELVKYVTEVVQHGYLICNDSFSTISQPAGSTSVPLNSSLITCLLMSTFTVIHTGS